MSDSPVTTTIDDALLIIRIDDGKANAVGTTVISAIHAGLDEAETNDQVTAVVLLGKAGMFSAGFDLKVMKGEPEGARNLVKAGGELAMRMYGFSTPIVAGCTGHAIAAGALLLLASDVRIGAEGTYQVGLPEVSLGMPLPIWATELARDRISKRHFTAATQLSKSYDPNGAVDAGFLDLVVDPAGLEDEVLGQARELGERLSGPGFVPTRRNTRQLTIDSVLATLDADMNNFFVG